jgi:mRNA interferase RelE/StbE
VNIEITEAFLKEVQSARNAELEKRVSKMLARIKAAPSLINLPQIVAMSGHPGYYRCRLGDFRAGFEIQDGVIVFLRCLHRREIYRFFP